MIKTDLTNDKKRSYAKVTNQRRAELIELLTRTNCTIKDACI